MRIFLYSLLLIIPSICLAHDWVKVKTNEFHDKQCLKMFVQDGWIIKCPKFKQVIYVLDENHELDL